MLMLSSPLRTLITWVALAGSSFLRFLPPGWQYMCVYSEESSPVERLVGWFVGGLGFVYLSIVL